MPPRSARNEGTPMRIRRTGLSRPCSQQQHGTKSDRPRRVPTSWGLLVLLISSMASHKGSAPSFLSSSCGVEAAMMFGVQSGGAIDGGAVAMTEGSRYATSMFFDSDIERLHITGSVYYTDASLRAGAQPRRDCFLSSLQLSESSGDNRGPTWVRQNSYGAPITNTSNTSSTANSSVTCSSIFMGKYQGIRTYFVAGYADVDPDLLVTTAASSDAVTPRVSENGGLVAARSVDRYGFLAELNYAAHWVGGQTVPDDATTAQDRVQYPIAMVGNGTDGRGLIVATVHSSAPYSSSMYKRYIDSQLTLQPNPDVTGAFLPPRFEKGCSVSITGWEQTKMNENVGSIASETTTTAASSSSRLANNATIPSVYDNLQPTWTKELRSREGDSVFLSSLLVHPLGDLLVAGYTAGTSSDFGASQPDGTIDSFVTSLNPSSGATIRSMRLQSLANSTDLILGLCAPPPPLSPTSNTSSASSSSSSSFYVVGMTNEPTEADLLFPESGSYKSFVLKLGLDTFQLEWSTEFNAVPASGTTRGDVMAMSCAVTSDSALLYVAGTVKDGASLTLNGTTVDTTSSGGDDMFVAQIRTGDGSVRFVKQIGTEHDDWLASGDSLATDNQGNAIVLGNTRSSMFRPRPVNSSSSDESTTSDVVVFSINRRTGAHSTIIETSGNITADQPNVTTTPATNQTTSNETTTTNPTAAPTDLTFRHSSEAPSLAPGWSLRGNRTASPFVPSNATSFNSSSGSNNTADAPVKVEPSPSATGSSSSSSSKISDTILVASIAMLVAIIGASCAALFVVRYRRQKAKALGRTLTHAEDFPGMPHHQRSSQSSQRWSRGFGSRGGSPPRRGRNQHANADHNHDPTETSSCASYVSGETLRSSSRRQLDPKDRDTLLRLDPSLRSGSYDDEESDSRFSHPIPDQDRYHPSVSLNSVRRGGSAASPEFHSARPSCRSRESIDQWDARDMRESDRTMAMQTLSSNDDASYSDSDTIPTSRGGGEVHDEDGTDTMDRAGTATSATHDSDFRETIDRVPSSDCDEDDTTSMFDPSTIASASSLSARPMTLPSASADLLSSLGLRRSRDSVDTGYSVEMLFAKLRKKRGIDPEPSRSEENSEDESSRHRAGSDTEENGYGNRGVLS